MTPGFIALHAALPAASEDGGGGNMLLPETSDLVWGAVAFLIIAVVLIRYALPRFTKVLDERTRRIEEGLELAERAKGDQADAEVTGPDEVRLVGAELEDVRALARKADYLVEWDIPEEISMETYLARKKANSPKYAQVPEVSFLRTYVREDTVKCLCFYDAPDEEAVVRAREAVSTPIDRLHALEG